MAGMRKLGLVLGLVGGLGFAGGVVAAGLYTNGVPGVAAGTPYSHLGSRALVPVDTGLAGGQAPQTVAVEAFRIAALAAQTAAATATSTAAAATLNRITGTVTTEALSTAAGATYTFTLTNSLITANTKLMVDMYSGTNTATTAQVTVTSVTPGAGSAVIVFTNTGTAALNGTMLIVFHV